MLTLLSATPALAITGDLDVPDLGDDSYAGVGLTPARVEVDLDERTTALEVIVFNDTPDEQSLSVSVTGLGHTLEGVPTFEAPLGGEVDITGGGELHLAPGGSATVQLDIGFPDQVAQYAAVVASIDPVDPSRTVSVRTRVASLILLRGPRPWDQTVEAGEVGLEYKEGATEASLYVDVDNVGNAHVRPTGRFIVRQQGEQLAVVELPGENIIPGFARRLRAPWVPDPDASGPVEIELELDNGPSSSGSADLDDIPGRVAEERRDQGLPASGATLSVDNTIPAPLSVAAVLVLIATLAMLLFVWRRQRDEDEAGETAASVSGGGDEGG